MMWPPPDQAARSAGGSLPIAASSSAELMVGKPAQGPYLAKAAENLKIGRPLRWGVLVKPTVVP